MAVVDADICASQHREKSQVSVAKNAPRCLTDRRAICFLDVANVSAARGR
jgi:hypothetical protein